MSRTKAEELALAREERDKRRQVQEHIFSIGSDKEKQQAQDAYIAACKEVARLEKETGHR